VCEGIKIITKIVTHVSESDDDKREHPVRATVAAT